MEISKTLPHIDTLWISFILPVDLDISNRLNVDIFRSFFAEINAIEEAKGNNTYLFDTKLGLSAYLGNKYRSKDVHLQLKADGQFLYLSGAYEATVELVYKITETFGLLGSIQRIDISQTFFAKDFSLQNPFTLIPDFLDKNTCKLIEKAKSKRHFGPEYFPYFNHPTDSKKQTGFMAKRTKFRFKLYEKILQVIKAYREKRISKAYYDYWMNCFMENEAKSASRFELSLLRESCNFASTLIFNEKKFDEQELAKKVLAHFGKSHRIKDFDVKEQKYKEYNKFWDELFYISEYQSLKSIKEETNISPNLNSFKTSPTKKRAISSILKSLAKALVNDEVFNVDHITSDLLIEMKEYMKEEKKQLDQYQETLKFFGTSEEELKKIQSKIFYYKDKIKDISKDIEEKEDILAELYKYIE